MSTKYIKRWTHEGNQSFVSLKLLFGILILICLLQNKAQKERNFDPFLYPVQEIQTEKHASGRRS